MTTYILAPSTLHYLFKLLLQFIFYALTYFPSSPENFLFFRRFFFPWLFCGKSCVFLSLISPIIHFPYFSYFYLANLSVNWRVNILKKRSANSHWWTLLTWARERTHRKFQSKEQDRWQLRQQQSRMHTPSTRLCVINFMYKGCMTILMTGDIEWLYLNSRWITSGCFYAQMHFKKEKLFT